MTAARITSPLQIPTAGLYRMDPQRSEVSYAGRHMFGLGVVHATFALRSGELRVGDPVTTSAVSVTVDAGSFSSNSAKRDKDVRGASLLDVARHPDITFVSNGVGTEPGTDGWMMTGTVTAHAHTVPVEVLIDGATPETDGVRLHGRVRRLDRYDFGITGSKGMVGRYLDLELDVFATPTS